MIEGSDSALMNGAMLPTLTVSTTARRMRASDKIRSCHFSRVLNRGC